MKKIYTVLFLVVLFLGLNSNTYAQPEFKIFLKGGFNLAMQDMKGDLFAVEDSNTYRLENGYALGGAVKYYFGSKRKVGLALDIMYNMFTNDKDSGGFEYKNKMNIFTIGLGAEYDFMPKGRFNPYIGAGLTGNFFSGEVTVPGESAGSSTVFTMKSTSRFGAYGDLGADIMFSKQYGFNLGFRYNMANLLNKGHEESVNTAGGEYGLNDDDQLGSEKKSIGWLQIYAGFSLGLNHPRVRTR